MPESDELLPYRYRDVGAVVEQVLSEHRARAGDAFLVLVREPSKAQVVERVARIRGGRWRALDQMGRSDLIRRVVDAMPVPQWPTGSGPDHSVLTIVMRRGFTVMGRDEGEWFNAWRFANCSARVYTMEIVLVTEHGWCDVFTADGGSTPRLVA